MTQKQQQSQLVKVRSKDGSQISFQRSGSGQPLLLVHGALMDAPSWSQLIPLLETSFSVCALDRRGRHESQQAGPFDPQREVEDLFAVVETLAGPAHIFGHSSGGTLALMALEQGLPVDKLILYEPPLAEDAMRSHWLTVADQLEVMVQQDQLDRAARHFLIEAARNSPQSVDRMQAGPYWASITELASASFHDPRIVAGYKAGDLSKIEAPALLLTGSDSLSWLRQFAYWLAEELPNASLRELPGQGHFAMYTGPELLASEIKRFLGG